MYRRISDFLNDWKYESASTIKLYNAITNDVLNTKVYAEGRSLLILAGHINHTLSEMMGRAGLPIEENKFEYTNIEELIAHYEKDAQLVAVLVAANWTDEQLEDKVNMYEEEWSKGTILQILITHQTHHRGQLTVLMRQAGLKVPGIYGPSKEEWIAYGQEPLI